MSVADTLSTAADLIEARGLAHGGFLIDGRVCAMQALWSATGAKGSVGEYTVSVVNGLATLSEHNAYRNAAITLQRAVAPMSIARWSDTHDQAEVVETLRAVAAEQRAELARLGRS